MQTFRLRSGLPTLCFLMVLRWTSGSPIMADEPAAPKKGNTVTVNDKDNGTKRELALGDGLAVRLEVRLGTGYSYQIVKGAGAVLKTLGKPKTVPGSGKPGSKEYQVFQFRAVKAGADKLELHYRRPFDKKDKPSAKVFRLQVTVKK